MRRSWSLALIGLIMIGPQPALAQRLAMVWPRATAPATLRSASGDAWRMHLAFPTDSSNGGGRTSWKAP